MKIAFIIDKTQTFQIIAKMLKTALQKKYTCDVYCCFDIDQLKYVKDYYGEYISKINWVTNKNRNVLVNQLLKNRKSYDSVVGINFYNRALRPIFESNNIHNYGLEYCWNEIYNSTESKASNFKSSGTLFCNSLKTKKMIGEIIGFENLDYLGSPWYEFLDENKVLEKDNKIVFMVPHQSFYNRVPGLRKYVNLFLEILGEYCKKNKYELLLKTRSKYSENYNNAKNVKIISDSELCSHISTYKNAKLVVNFCSSAINELTYLQVPFLVIGTQIQKKLHPDMRCDEGIKLIHTQYYNGLIFDKVHCESIEIEDDLNFNILSQLFDNLIDSNKDWDTFQENFFCGNFKGSSERIFKKMEKNAIKKNSVS